MIYSGLEFAQYFEIDVGSNCNNILMAVTPATRMVFTFIQMYFIFLNAKVRSRRLLKTKTYFSYESSFRYSTDGRLQAESNRIFWLDAHGGHKSLRLA